LHNNWSKPITPKW